MNKLLRIIRQSLPTKLILWIAILAGLVFLASLGFLFTQSRKSVRQEAINRAEQVLDNTVQRVTNILDQVEVATRNIDWLPPRHLDSPDSMYIYSRRILELNPDLNGCSISFEPYYFPHEGKYFSIFSYNDNGTILTTQEGNENYEYFNFDWYQMSKLLDRPCWTEPYLDYNPDNIYSPEMIASYCTPIKDSEGRYIGTFSTDISLSWLSETISAVKPYPHSYSIMTGRGGTFFVHPDSTKLVYQTIFTETLDHPDPDRFELGKAMQAGKEGMKELTIDGEDCYVFYKPLATTGWSVGIVCPVSDILSGYRRLRSAALVIVLLGLILMLDLIGRVIRHELQPLGQLTEQARTIASGDFNEELPDEGRIDEIGQLTQSFTGMQHSLVKYIAELKDTTAQKASIENELKVASDIQMGMVPRIFPPFPNRHDIDLFAAMTPAKEVGGDLYDFFVQDDKLYFCIGDVSGKGVPASLFMAVTRNLFRIIAQQGHAPAEIATQINSVLSQDNDQGMFVTMFIGVADLKTGTMSYCNCGHNPPVVVRPGAQAEFIKLKYTNMPLGIWEGGSFSGEDFGDFRNTLLLLYTDGLNEAENQQKELFGNDAVIDLVNGTAGLSASEVIRVLQAAVEKHREGTVPNDDLTLLCLRLMKA
ncbi:MAG: SpoIIE family protein phosphatase [Bacteroidales bacterium]|nr:SpoIIE family protein phosphatase [Bacteroidales bacterium]